MTRINRHNGDGHLRLDQRVAWLAFNAFDNRRAYSGIDPEIVIADFQCPDALAGLETIPGTPSPSRTVCDLFWMRAPWARMERELGPLRIADLGCGSGEYGVKYARWSCGTIDRYVGLDLQAHPRWSNLTQTHAFMEFREGDMEHLDELIPPDTNVIVSQSALEHVRNDLACFARLHAFASRARQPLWQLHLVPSQACLRLYLWHGYRQYTPRTLSDATRLFAGCERWVVRLGGAACNQLHWKFVTWPLMRRQGDMRDGSPSAYRARLAAAIAQDMTSPQSSPSFYAIVIAPRLARSSDFDCWRRIRN